MTILESFTMSDLLIKKILPKSYLCCKSEIEHLLDTTLREQAHLDYLTDLVLICHMEELPCHHFGILRWYSPKKTYLQ